jgi:hypothetical protein
MNASGLIAGVKHPYGESSRLRHHSSRNPAPGFSAPGRYSALKDQSLPEATRKPKARRTVLGAAVLYLGCLFLSAGIGFQRWRKARPWTDQARVERDGYPVSSRLEGTIAKIFVSNGQYNGDVQSSPQG